MNFYFMKNKSLFVSVFLLVFFELLSYFLLKDNIFNLYFSARNIWYLVLINVALIVFSCFWVSFPNFLKEERVFKVIIIFLLDLSVFLFLFFSSSFFLNQIIVVASVFLFFPLFRNLGSQDVRFKFVNATSFLSAFLFFFSAYSLLENLFFPYWVTALMIVVFSTLLLYYKLEHTKIDKTYKNFYLILSAIIMVEVFFASLFWPAPSLFLRSLILVATYYFSWGMIDLQTRGVMNRVNVAVYFSIFVFILVLIGLAILIKNYMI